MKRKHSVKLPASVLAFLFVLAIPFFAVADGLQEYHLTIDQVHLDSLYANPSSSTEYPAVLSCSAGTSECFVRFRGKSAIQFPKKSWALILSDSSLLGRERLNLNSEYMDPGMMRNCIAMHVSRFMDLPASETEHCKFFVNDEYYGVYLDVERVDSYYFQRFSISPVAVFKGCMEGARFMNLQSGFSQEQAYRPCGDESIVNINVLDNFIDCVNAGVEPLPVDVENLMGYYAVNLALLERDSGSNNYYFVLCSDGKWRVFPWDRGSCLGGVSNGEFYPEMVDDTSLPYFRVNSLYQQLIKSPANMEMFESNMVELSDLLSIEVPLLIDSVFNEIRCDLYEDPLSMWTPEEIDQAYEDLVWFVEERANFLKETIPLPESASVILLDITDPWLLPGETTQITVGIDSPFNSASLKWVLNGTVRILNMNPVPGYTGTQWTREFVMPPNVNYCPVGFYFLSAGDETQYFFHPSSGFQMYYLMPSAHPGVVRLAPGCNPPGPGDDCDFTILAPIIYGSSLWAVPVVNNGGCDVDISGCVFVAGNTPHRVFAPSQTIVSEGDTLFITNSFQRFCAEFPDRNVLGNCACSSPGGGTITMLDPGWGELWTMPVPADIEAEPFPVAVMVTEVNFIPGGEYNCGDWVELYNPADTSFNIGGFVLSDRDGNQSMIPWDTVIEPGGFHLLVREEFRFTNSFPAVECAASELGFGLDSQSDNLSVFDRSGERLCSIAWSIDDYSSSGSAGVLGLISPFLPVENLDSWELAPFPGSPGEPNRLWKAGGEHLQLRTLYPNPVKSGSISFDYTSLTWPVRVFVLDLSGRVVIDRGLLDSATGSYSIDLPIASPAGIYFLVLQSAGWLAAEKFTIL